jgi:hypothetical protein
MIERMATYSFLRRLSSHVPVSRLTCREANRPWSSAVQKYHLPLLLLSGLLRSFGLYRQFTTPTVERYHQGRRNLSR